MQTSTYTSDQTAQVAPARKDLAALIAIVAALGGLLFGYDTGIIGVALLGLSQDFVLNDTLKQFVTGAIIFGALFGCLLTGPISDRIGRRRTIIGVGLVFALGSLLSALSPSVGFLVVSRFLLGLSAGSSTQIIPVYIAEVAPPQHRGKLVVLFQLMVMTGITVAYFTGFALGEHWRWMFGLGVVPALILLAGMAILPESPRWLLVRGREAAALSVLTHVRGDAHWAARELEEIKTVSREPQGTWRDLRLPWIRPAVIVGGAIAMFSQITGVNAMIYYAPTILTQAGFSTDTAVLATGSSTILVVLMTWFGSVLVDRIGRRRYLLWLIPGSIAALIGMGLLFQSGGPTTTLEQWLVVLCLAGYLMLNCGGFGVCIWLINSEVYPLFIRGKGASVGAFSHWFFDLLVTLTTLSLVTALGAANTFWMYAAISTGALLFIWRYVPETRGKSLEQIEHELREHRFYPFQQKTEH
ncbi:MULTISPECIES: sugar porter family MFS transporter [Pseudomonadota]|uniref:sugar porter family MFS transporter n=1 Tax=Pseudomonadota TaxID=1224 RepID=UPI0000388ACF|nr:MULTISPECIES: sugar porter family MFS transporter [Pseudomonadota]EBA44435.1 sugar transporter family protein [Burkholderia pseudomallei 305]GLK61498.1 MFS transporter [Azotobacter vinelandii]SFY33201.1 MFS transporter, sugar porter (SP) family [Azotobacter vinelandii]